MIIYSRETDRSYSYHRATIVSTFDARRAGRRMIGFMP